MNTDTERFETRRKDWGRLHGRSYHPHPSQEPGQEKQSKKPSTSCWLSGRVWVHDQVTFSLLSGPLLALLLAYVTPSFWMQMSAISRFFLSPGAPGCTQTFSAPLCTPPYVYTVSALCALLNPCYSGSRTSSIQGVVATVFYCLSVKFNSNLSPVE
jgi:hypothetical protein